MIETRSPGRTFVDLGADRDDVGRELVAEDLRQLGAGQRVRLGRGDDRPGDVLVQVGAADPAPARLDQHLGRAEPLRSGAGTSSTRMSLTP